MLIKPCLAICSIQLSNSKIKGLLQEERTKKKKSRAIAAKGETYKYQIPPAIPLPPAP
jgi:hypothetical protein